MSKLQISISGANLNVFLVFVEVPSHFVHPNHIHGSIQPTTFIYMQVDAVVQATQDAVKPIAVRRIFQDDDTIYHMNYSIPEVDNDKPKAKPAGWIIPAIATLTAMATGLVLLELYKVLDGGHKLEDYRNAFIFQLSAASLFNG